MRRAQDRTPPPTSAEPPPSATSTTKSQTPPLSSTASQTTSSSADLPPTTAEPLLEMKATIDVVQVDAEDERDAQDDETSPPQKFQRVPRVVCDAFDAAIREMDRRAHEGVAEENAHLGHFPRVTIASHITQEMLDRIPDEWLEDRGVELLPGRVLANVYASTQEKRVHGDVIDQVEWYADANNLLVGCFTTETLGNDSGAPFIGLATRPSADGTRPSTLLVLFAADVNKRSGPEILVAVAEWLTHHPSVQCVIYFKFFPRLRTNTTNETNIPAIAFAIHRGDGYEQVNGMTLCRVVIAETRSFGNASIPPSALDAFLAQDITPTAAPHVLLQNPFDSAPIGLLQASCLFPSGVDRAAIGRSLYRVLETARETSRVRAELARLRAEATRLRAEAERLQAEAERLQAEAERLRADAARDQTEVARARAEMAHVQAEVVRNEEDEVNSDDVAFSVAMVAQLPPIRLDLIVVYWQALKGHTMDFPVVDPTDPLGRGAVEAMGDGDNHNEPMDMVPADLDHADVPELAVPAVGGAEGGDAWVVDAD